MTTFQDTTLYQQILLGSLKAPIFQVLTMGQFGIRQYANSVPVLPQNPFGTATALGQGQDKSEGSEDREGWVERIRMTMCWHVQALSECNMGGQRRWWSFPGFWEKVPLSLELFLSSALYNEDWRLFCRCTITLGHISKIVMLIQQLTAREEDQVKAEGSSKRVSSYWNFQIHDPLSGKGCEVFRNVGKQLTLKKVGHWCLPLRDVLQIK